MQHEFLVQQAHLHGTDNRLAELPGIVRKLMPDGLRSLSRRQRLERS